MLLLCYLSRGWVPSTSICYFNKETWEQKFLERVAATDVNYRAAVWEALSLVDGKGFGPPVGQVFRDLEKVMTEITFLLAYHSLSSQSLVLLCAGLSFRSSLVRIKLIKRYVANVLVVLSVEH